VVSCEVSFGDAADDIGCVVLSVAYQQRVEAVLGLQGSSQLVAATGERGITPPLGVGCVLGVPGLMGPEEVPEPEGSMLQHVSRLPESQIADDRPRLVEAPPGASDEGTAGHAAVQVPLRHPPIVVLGVSHRNHRVQRPLELP
jgi:hypothetical protein